MEELEDSGAKPFVESLGKESGLAMNFTPETASKGPLLSSGHRFLKPLEENRKACHLDHDPSEKNG